MKKNIMLMVLVGVPMFLAATCASLAISQTIRLQDDSGFVPEAPEKLVLQPAENGLLSGTLSFTTPILDVAGDTLDALTKVEVLLDGEPFTTISQPETGAEITMDVTVQSDGFHRFGVTASNTSGESATAEVSAYFGRDVPAAPTGISLRDNFDGTATISWDAHPDKGMNGAYVDTTTIRYRVYVEEEPMMMDLLLVTKEPQAIIDISQWNAGAPNVLSLEVRAFDDRNYEGDPSSVKMVVGQTEEIPYTESFTDGEPAHFWWTSIQNGSAFWEISENAYDEDGGAATFLRFSSGDVSDFSSGKISVKGIADPKASFFWRGDPGAITVELLADRQDGSSPVVLWTQKLNAADRQWHEAMVDLVPFVDDDYVVLRFRAASDLSLGSFEFDNLYIRDIIPHDLSLSITTAPEVAMGKDIRMYVDVANLGGTPVENDDYRVDIYQNGQLFTTLDDLGAIAPYQGVVSRVLDIPTCPFSPDLLEWSAVLVYEPDLNEDNNSGEATVELLRNSMPTVDDLTAEVTTWPAVRLSWTTTGFIDVPGVVIIEDFEDQDDFEPLSVGGISASEHWGTMGDWTLYDPNGLPTRTLSQCAGYENEGAPMAFQVFNSDYVGLDMTDQDVVMSLGANSGEQMLLSMGTAAEDALPSDRWLISPLLSGGAQTIRFFVSQVASGENDETFEVLYSTTDMQPDSFQKIYDGTVSSIDWTEILINLPARSRYFAIRSTSSKGSGLEIDDIIYTAAPSKKQVSSAAKVLGYRIYRDSVLIAKEEPAVSDFVDLTADPTIDHTYYVTVIYPQGESPLSNPATISLTGIALPAEQASFTTGMTFYSLSGAVVATGSDAFNRLPAGIYLVKDHVTGRVRRVVKN